MQGLIVMGFMHSNGGHIIISNYEESNLPSKRPAQLIM